MWSASVPPQDDGGTYFFCSIRAESHAIRRRSGVPKSRVIVAGPGADAMMLAVERAPDDVARALLIGFASGIGASAARGVHSVERVIAPDGRALVAPWIVEQLPRATLVSVSDLPGTPEAKAALVDRSGAALADRAGHAFAAAATRRRWRWGIVRAVFDGPDIGYPAGMDDTVSASGRTRVWRAILWSMRMQQSGTNGEGLMRNFQVGAAQMALVAKSVMMADGAGTRR